MSGLIANKLLEKYQRPIFVLRRIFEEETQTEYYNGSMRAVGVENFRSLINSSRLCEADGHEYASGFKIELTNFDNFKVWLQKELKDLEFKVCVDIDIEINISDVSRILIDKIKSIDRISGNGFKPVIALIRRSNRLHFSNVI